MAVSVDHQETQNPSLQNQVPGLAELAIEQTFAKPASKPWYKSIPFPKLPRKHKTSKPQVNQETQNQPASKPAAKPGNKTRLAVVNKTSKQQIEFASLAWLETALQWVENFIHILTPRLLVAGFVLSMVDLLTNGNLLQNGYMIYIWAIIQALAVDATLPNMWRLAFTRFDERRWLAGSILLIIGAGLGLVVFSALAIQFLQQSENLPLNVAMGKLHVSPEILSYVRSGSVVFLAAILSVLNRTKVTPRSQNQAENKTSLQNQALSNQAVNQPQNQAVNQASLQTSLQNPSLQNQDETVDPGVNHKEQNTGQIVALPGLRLMDYGEDNKGQQIRALLQGNPHMSPGEIIQLTGASKGYVSRQRAIILGEMGITP